VKGIFVGGEWRAPHDRRALGATSPATGEALGDFACGSAADVDAAVTAAAAGAAAMRRLTPMDRARLCHRVADRIHARREALGRLVALEQGKPLLTEALPEVDEAVECFRIWGEEGRRLEGTVFSSADPQKRIFATRRPRGVYAIVTPWNWPLTMPAELLAPALAAGNAVVWVPAPSTSLIAIALQDCLAEAELPPGACNLVTGPGAIVGDAAVAHPGTHAVAFIGSIATGHRVAARAAGKPLLLELGGNGPFIVCADADISRAAKAAAVGAFLCAGQSCAAAERILVHTSVAAPFLEALCAEVDRTRLGHPLDPDTTMGPLNNGSVADKTERHVEEARRRGATICRGGRRAPGRPTPLYYEPTVLSGVTPGMEIFEEETFGPVAPVATFDREEALCDLVRGPYGLVGAVWSRDVARALALAESLDCGVVNVNETTNYWELHVPYGGMRHSGVGRIGGRASIEAMTDVQTIILDLRRDAPA